MQVWEQMQHEMGETIPTEVILGAVLALSLAGCRTKTLIIFKIRFPFHKTETRLSDFQVSSSSKIYDSYAETWVKLARCLL